VYVFASEPRRASSRARLINIGPSWCIKVRKSLSEICTNWAEIFSGEFNLWIIIVKRPNWIEMKELFEGSPIVRCLNRHTHSRLAGNKFHTFWIMFESIKKVMYKITAHFGGREMKVWHMLEQDCDTVMCHFSHLHNVKYRVGSYGPQRRSIR
jgi:hypothetical protein